MHLHATTAPPSTPTTFSNSCNNAAAPDLLHFPPMQTSILFSELVVTTPLSLLIPPSLTLLTETSLLEHKSMASRREFPSSTMGVILVIGDSSTGAAGATTLTPTPDLKLFMSTT
ncbi:hypothetical protein VIGAN_01504100 [Vigna angularis var. angularis]|uniref:Uncharacterized protein n=1 Tax=Vigna angularis var. angularis TaxID=157739 RepID=A0A0S3R8P1_PHAAN|nr:hypothetical protein VIGAN_01504100 [Vigna angularis var. angularis]